MGFPGLTWIEAIIGFGFLILIHELGHFIALKMVGLPVYAFSIGFGKSLWERRIGQTVFRIGRLPFGGYVMPEDPEELERREQAGEDILPVYPPGKSFLVAFFGPLANFITAFVLLFIILVGWGQPVPVPVIKSMVPGGPAASAGLRIGDRILQINDAPVKTWPELINRIQDSAGNPFQLRVKRQQEEISLSLTPSREGGRLVIGIRPDHESKPCSGWGEAFLGAAQTTVQEFAGVFHGLAGLFSRSGVQHVSGPLAILNMASDSARGGLVSFLFFLSMLSINLGVFNLLPFPPLDGIRILMAAWHALTGQPPREKVLIPVFQWGTLGLVALFFLVTLKDIGGLLFT
jgi:regulator of sigma E protease